MHVGKRNTALGLIDIALKKGKREKRKKGEKWVRGKEEKGQEGGGVSTDYRSESRQICQPC